MTQPQPLLESIRRKLKSVDNWNNRTGGTQGVILRLGFGDVVQLDAELNHRDTQLSTAQARADAAETALATALEVLNECVAVAESGESDIRGIPWKMIDDALSAAARPDALTSPAPAQSGQASGPSA